MEYGEQRAKLDQSGLEREKDTEGTLCWSSDQTEKREKEAGSG